MMRLHGRSLRAISLPNYTVKNIDAKITAKMQCLHVGGRLKAQKSMYMVTHALPDTDKSVTGAKQHDTNHDFWNDASRGETSFEDAISMKNYVDPGCFFHSRPDTLSIHMSMP